MNTTSRRKRTLQIKQQETLLAILKVRFEENMKRHKAVVWGNVEMKILAQPEKLWSLNRMEETGGEPDVVAFDKKSGTYIFFDCATESPKDRRSVCYDHKARVTRKEHAPKNSALEMANEMGVKLLTEAEYRTLQKLGEFDTKTSSWIATPDNIRMLGGALFADYRYGTVFVYHNGAESYYAARGFRCSLSI